MPAIRCWSCIGIGVLSVVAGLAVPEARAAARDLLVSNGYGRSVLRFDGTTGECLGAFVPPESGGLGPALGIAFGPDGNLYVGSGPDSVKRYNGQTGAFIDTFASGAELHGPFHVVFGPDGHLYVSSYWNNQLLRYNGTTGAFIDVFIPAGSCGLSGPTGFLFAPGDNLYVSSRNNNQILRYNAKTGACIGIFIPSSSSPDGPGAMTFGPDGNLYISAYAGHGVKRYNGQTGAFIDDFVPQKSPDQPGAVVNPTGLAFGPDGNLYVISSLANCIQRYDGTTGAFMGTFASGCGLNTPWRLVFTPGIIRVATAGDDANDGSSWAAAKRTVRAGLNAALAGDQVWVAAGTYVECITLIKGVALHGGFTGNETILSHRNWTANRTILDGNQQGSVVTSPEGATHTTRIDGFTIRNGSGTSVGLAWSGGGIYCAASSPTITNNTITGNTADWGGAGGGIYCHSSSPIIANNTITGNTATGGEGGGICCEYDSSPMIANNTISGNTAGPGSGIYCTGPMTIVNNTIVGNSAGAGGGIYCAGPPTIANTIVAFNSSGIYLADGNPTLRYNCLYGNTGYNYSGTDPTGTNGNLSADPLFVRDPSPGPDCQWFTPDDDYGDLHLWGRSPCIDAGDNTAVPIGVTTDLAGRSRFIDHPTMPDTGAGTSPIVDMGAYESLAAVPADLDGDRDVDRDDFEAFESCASGPGLPLSSGCENRDFDSDSDVNQADFAVFQRCFSGDDNPADPNCVY